MTVHPTIQAAIDAVNEGDEVILAPSTFTGAGNRDLRFNGKAVTVRGTDPNDANVVAATVIDCGGSEADPHRGFIFDANEGPDSVVAGLTVVNGYGPTETIGALFVSAGGAIYCYRSSPTIVNCRFTDNVAADYGGALCSYMASPTVTGCAFLNNGAGAGGAVYSEGPGVTVSRCTFTGNVAVSDGGAVYELGEIPSLSDSVLTGNSSLSTGGAIWWQAGNAITGCTITRNSSTIGGAIYGANVFISGCTIAGNSASSNGGGIYLDGHSHWIDSHWIEGSIISNNVSGSHGGGVYSGWYGHPLLRSCIIADNEAALDGGGVYGSSYSEPNLVNCTMSGNVAGGLGGGVFGDDTSRTTIRNSILWADSATSGGELALTSRHEGQPAEVTVLYSDVRGGPNSVYADPNTTLTWGEGNLDSDPLFVNPAGPDGDPNTWEDNDYHLAYGSPCRNTGDPRSTSAHELDIDGEARVMGGQVDIGADEWTYYTYTCGHGAGAALAMVGVVLLTASLARRAGRSHEQ